MQDVSDQLSALVSCDGDRYTSIKLGPESIRAFDAGVADGTHANAASFRMEKKGVHIKAKRMRTSVYPIKAKDEEKITDPKVLKLVEKAIQRAAWKHAFDQETINERLESGSAAGMTHPMDLNDLLGSIYREVSGDPKATIDVALPDEGE